MRSLFLSAVALVSLGVVGLQAAPILAPPIAACSTLASGGTANDLFFLFGVWSAPNFACEQQDKIYSNFSLGAIPTDTTLRIQLQPIGPQEFHTLTVNGNFGTAFTFSYDIAIDLTLNPSNRITAVTGDISNPSNAGTPSNTKTVFTEGGAMIGSLVSTQGNPGGSILLSQTAVHVVDAYLPNAGAAVSISNTFRQDINAVPEPASFALIGGGLLMLATRRRSRRA
jgi:hypothetical protein